MIAFLYRRLTDAAGLGAPWYLRRRARHGKEDPSRLRERFGYAAIPRPGGKLVWLHAASVGESLSLLPVIEKLHERLPAATILMTTGTLTSARLLAERLPPGVVHQFVPIDYRPAVRRFMDHWRPDLALIVESELWPNLLDEAEVRAVPIILVNGRLSARSFRRWRAWPKLSRRIFGKFVLILAQDQLQASRFEALGAGKVEPTGDLKAAMAPLPADPEKLARLKAAIAGRPVWLAASTHPGEEEMVIGVHQALELDFPGLLTLLAPRHPNRAETVAAEIEKAGLRCRRHSEAIVPDAGTQIYVIDTMGELGVFYRLAPIVLVAGSLAAKSLIGGHNSLEAAALGRAILHGPDTVNSAAITQALDDCGAARRVEGVEDLILAVRELLRHPERAAAMGEVGIGLAAAQRSVIDRVMSALDPWLGRL